eukprot:Sdes_comp16967_c2_seq2m6173
MNFLKRAPQKKKEDNLSEKAASLSLNEAEKPSYSLPDFQRLQTLGTGTFGRVFLCRYKATEEYFAMKALKKVEVVRLKQVEHILSEKKILSIISHPFIVNM